VKILERICLEGAQAGLAWITILRKRENYRKAFKGFDPQKLARFTEKDVERLMQDAGIVRNRLKIEAAIANGKATVELRGQGVDLSDLFWSFAPDPPRKGKGPKSFADVPAETPESKALSKELKKRGFRFVGPTTVYAAMQACGVVNDHLAQCHVREAVERDRGAATSRG
jgi:DNA-3-methyladenine glycosylase I